MHGVGVDAGTDSSQNIVGHGFARSLPAHSVKIVHEVNIPDKISIQELSNRMAMQASSIIKHLLGMGVVATINHTIDADTAEYLVKEFGNIAIREKKLDLNILKSE